MYFRQVLYVYTRIKETFFLNILFEMGLFDEKGNPFLQFFHYYTE
jgi:hypothetical protein